MTRFCRSVWFVIACSGLVAACGDIDGARGDSEPVSPASSALTTAFSTGALVIPLDRNADGLDDLPSYGLVYQLLAHNVPVQWAIRTGKPHDGIDVKIDAPASVRDLASGAALAMPVTYHGGPFVIAPADRAAAMPIITAWQASHPTTAVDLVTGTFAAEIAKTLTAAPSIAVFNDGHPEIAAEAFNAAGIPDSTGAAWPERAPFASPDVLSAADIAGATNTSHTDGALWNADRTPRYCQLFSMHYSLTTPAGEAVQEVRAWLDGNKANHAFMQCEAVAVFENDPHGRYLSTGGLHDDSGGGGANRPPTALLDHAPSEPVTQLHGDFEGVRGLIASIGLVSGSQLRAGAQAVVAGTSPALNGQGWWLVKGRLDGDPGNGRVTYLAGHDYLSTDPAIIPDLLPRPSGVKVLLNSLFDAGCATPTQPDGGQPIITLTKSAPATVTDDQITYTLHYANTGNGVATGAMISDALPAGTTFVAASNAGRNAAGTVTWKIGNLAPGASGDVTVTVHLTSDGTYTNQAVVSFQIGISTKTVPSNMTTTTLMRCAGGDRDCDGVLDAGDNCPDTPNADQADRDHDGVGDACQGGRTGNGLTELGVSGGGCSAGGDGVGLAGIVALVVIVGLRRRRAMVAGAVLAAAALPRPAAAQAVAQVVMEPASFGVERFQLASDRDGLFDVEWAEVRGDQRISAALWAGLANDPLVLYRGVPGDRVGSLVANRAGGGLGASISPNHWLQLGFDLPLVLYQNRPGSSVLGMMESLTSFGTGNLRLIPKLVVLHQADHGVSLAVVPTVIVPTRSTSDAYFDDRGFGFAPEIVLSRKWIGWRTSLDVGYHARHRAQFLNQVIDDELFSRAGVGYQFADRGGPPVGVDVTLSGATAARAPLENFNENHLETLAGATYDLPGGAQLFAGAGAGLRKGYGTPDWRGLAGVRIGFAASRESRKPAPPPPVPVPPVPVPPVPAPPVPPPPPPCIVVEGVHFKTDLAVIEPSSYPVLDHVAEALKEHGDLSFEVEGHTDSRGGTDHNQDLSQRRAAAVVEYLVSKGIAANRLTPAGFGETRPIDDNDTVDGRARNRRVVFTPLSGGGCIDTLVPAATPDTE